MSDAINVSATVLGGEDAKARFMRVGDSIRGRLSAALAVLGRDAVSTAQAAAPHKTGKLARSIRARLAETDKAITLTVKPGVFYAGFQEFGVVNHGTRRNQALSGGGRVRVHRVRGLRASGQWRVPPHPFMARADEVLRSRLTGALNEAIAESVAAEE